MSRRHPPSEQSSFPGQLWDLQVDAGRLFPGRQSRLGFPEDSASQRAGQNTGSNIPFNVEQTRMNECGKCGNKTHHCDGQNQKYTDTNIVFPL